MAAAKSNTVPGFKSFWEKSKRIAASQNLTFVQVEIENPNEPKSNKNKGSKVRRRESSTTISHGGLSESPPPENRRKQVYQAQRRHRQRKTEYAKSLEDEISQLERMHAAVTSETRGLSEQNDAIRILLQSKGLGEEIEQAKLRRPNTSAGVAATLSAVNDSPTMTFFETHEADLPRRSKRQREARLKELLNSSDPQIDSKSRQLIEKSKKLLLRDVKPFQSDEAEEKKAWEDLADLVLDCG